ncbi:hypothetical protein [Pseudalkalibacillus sp. SCS-8]|uniref:hypothetical protein n=1 Tax=Pseudalkalibacillus nanhaiensis TaxID=3115291 RepID=UPI0032DA1BE3
MSDLALSSMMAKNLSQLRHTLNMNLLDSNLAKQAAQSTVMLKDLQETQQQIQHPTSGHRIDLRG